MSEMLNISCRDMVVVRRNKNQRHYLTKSKSQWTSEATSCQREKHGLVAVHKVESVPTLPPTTPDQKHITQEGHFQQCVMCKQFEVESIMRHNSSRGVKERLNKFTSKLQVVQCERKV